MDKRLMVVGATAMLALAASTATAAEERYADAVGDAVGESPDIVSVTVSEDDEWPVVRFAVEFAESPPLESDMKTWADALFLMMSSEDTVDERGVLAGDYFVTGTHGSTMQEAADQGTILASEDDMFWHVVDVEIDDATLSFTFDRKLLGDPEDLYWQVLVGVERDQSIGEEEEEGDAYPDLGEPPGHLPAGSTGA